MKNKITIYGSFIASVCFFIASFISLLGENTNKTVGIINLALGVAWLGIGLANLKAKKK